MLVDAKNRIRLDSVPEYVTSCRLWDGGSEHVTLKWGAHQEVWSWLTVSDKRIKGWDEVPDLTPNEAELQRAYRRWSTDILKEIGWDG